MTDAPSTTTTAANRVASGTRDHGTMTDSPPAASSKLLGDAHSSALPAIGWQIGWFGGLFIFGVIRGAPGIVPFNAFVLSLVFAGITLALSLGLSVAVLIQNGTLLRALATLNVPFTIANVICGVFVIISTGFTLLAGIALALHVLAAGIVYDYADVVWRRTRVGSQVQGKATTGSVSV